MEVVVNLDDDQNIAHITSTDHSTNDSTTTESYVARVRTKRNTLISSKRPKHYDSDRQYGSSKQSSRKARKKPVVVGEKRPVSSHTCEVCHKTFTRKFHLTRHQASSCSSQSSQSAITFLCEICGKTYSRKDNLDQHLRSHSETLTRPKRYQCSYCEKAFHGRSLLEIHERVHNKECPFPCEHCEKRFPSNSALVKHRRVHTNERPYVCTECDLSFALKGTLNRHLYTHRTDRPFSCEFCQKTFIQSSNLRAHRFNHTGENGFKCLICGRVFNRKAILQMHVRYVHEKEQVLRCGPCNRVFMRREELQLHQQEHKDKKKSAFQCETCSKHFELKHSLAIHRLTHSRPTRLACSVCTKPFLSQSFLDKHIALEHSDRANSPSTSRAVQLEVGSDDSCDSMGSDDSRELCLSDEDFDMLLRRLLIILNDRRPLNAEPEQMLAGLIQKAGHQAVVNEDLEQSDQLRANLTLLLQQINEDAMVRSLLDSYSVDEVLAWLVNPVAIEASHD